MLDALVEHLPHNDIPELVVKYLAGDSVLDRDPDTILKVFPGPWRETVQENGLWIYKTFMDRERKVLHSFNDEPSMIKIDQFGGTIVECWHWNGKLHRNGDKPAVVGGFHRNWYQYGNLHRENGLPASICFGNKEWYLNGERCQRPSKYESDTDSENEF